MPSNSLTDQRYPLQSRKGYRNGMYRHGMKKTRFYGVWATMIQRCTNPNLKRYKDYGGRGIYVCDRWSRFDNFMLDMLSGYRVGLSLERKNNNGPYSPDNCIWATRSEQCRNSRRNRYLTFDGQTLTLGEWSKRLNITHSALFRRLEKWGFERAMTQLGDAWCYEI